VGVVVPPLLLQLLEAFGWLQLPAAASVADLLVWRFLLWRHLLGLLLQEHVQPIFAQCIGPIGFPCHLGTHVRLQPSTDIL
jgi:hypothetical protein